jgi:CRP-like cAMP-binding protein
MKPIQNQNEFLLFSSPWQRIPFFRGLSQELVRNLLTHAEFSPTRSKETIFEQDAPAEAFGFVVEGWIRLCRMDPRGQRVIMDFVGPGGLIGGLLMAQHETVYPIMAQSVGAGLFLKIPKQTYLDHWMDEPEIIRRTQNANMERMLAIHSTRELQKLSLEEKVIHILLRVCPSTPEVLSVNISRTDLADIIGASVESVIRLLSAWEKEGLLVKSQGAPDSIFKSRLIERIHK